jgi:Uma2 family endonuclease
MRLNGTTCGSRADGANLSQMVKEQHCPFPVGVTIHTREVDGEAKLDAVDDRAGKIGMSAAAIARPLTTLRDDCVILPHVSWETYERLLADDEERRVPRMTYDQGVLELVTPSMPHEEDARTIALIVEIVAANLSIPMCSAASTTFRRQDLERGFEADASFYIQNEARMRGKREVDLAVDPPPDLVLEMEMSRSALDKLRLFASMGIPEVWRCDGQRVTIFVREGDAYRESETSRVLSVLSSEVLMCFLADSRTMLSPDWFQAVSEWARAQRSASSEPATPALARQRSNQRWH